jgi:hypothetical protein
MITIKEYFNEAKLRYIFGNFSTLFPDETTKEEKDFSNLQSKKEKFNEFNEFNEFNKKSFLFNTVIKTILDTSKDGVFEAKYSQKNGKGRYYAEKSIGLCNLTRKIRHTITCDYSVDIDIKNSSPSILYNLLQKENEKLIGNDKFKYQNLENYIQHRDEFLQSICEIKNIDRKDAKALVVAVINNKYIPKNELISYPPKFVNFYWEMYHIRNKLAIVFADLFEETKREKEEKLGLKSEDDNEDDKNDLEISDDEEEEKTEILKTEKKINYMGSFMTKLLFNYENEIIMNCLNVFKEKNIAVHGLQYDGFPFDKKHKNDELLELCKEEVLKKMGFHIEFDFKELDEIIPITEKDLEPYKDIVEINKLIKNNIKKKELKKILDEIGNVDISYFNYEILYKSIYNILDSIEESVLFLSYWSRKSMYYTTKEEFRNLINDYVQNRKKKELNYNFENLEKIKREKVKVRFLKVREEKINKKIDELKEIEEEKEKWYQEIKNDFEKYFFKMENPLCYVKIKDDDIIFYSENDLKNLLQDKYQNEFNIDFRKKWVVDMNKRFYEKFVFDPSHIGNYDNKYNFFTGFKYDDIDINIDDKKYDENHIFLKLFKHNLGKEFEIFMSWLVHIIRHPEQKTGVIIILYSEVHGVGKNSIIDLIEKIFSIYVGKLEKIDDLTRNFNYHLCNKLIIYGDEISANARKIADQLKNAATRKQQNMEKKGKDIIKLIDYSNYIFTTNNECTVKIEEHDRRYLLIEGPKEKLSKEDFTLYHQELNNDESVKLFFEYLKNYDSKYDFTKGEELPMNEYKKRLGFESKPAYVQMLYFNSKEFLGKTITSTDLYKLSLEYASKNYLSGNYTITKFGEDIKKYIGDLYFRTSTSRNFNFPEKEEDFNNILKKADEDYFNYVKELK